MPGIIRSRDPKVVEYPFASTNSFLTPNEQFFIRNHFPEPQVDRQSWRLTVSGMLSNPLELTYEDILEMPARTVAATLECAGNNRVFLVPPARGVQWHLGGISNAEWTGVPLTDVLKRAGIHPQAVDVIFEGADSGDVEEEPKPSGPISFARSLPIAKALDQDVLLAYAMNGEELSPQHGFPLRAIVPGWYAVASVKWLTAITVSNDRFDGYFQTIDYAYWERKGGHPIRVPISGALAKAQIAQPQMHEIIAPNTNYRILGAAWAGESNLARVDISTDKGCTWSPANLLGAPVRYAWSLWEMSWHTPSTPGTYTILARATDERGTVQPMQHDPDHGTYMINHCLPITIEVQ